MTIASPSSGYPSRSAVHDSLLLGCLITSRTVVLATNLREVSKCPENAPTRAFFLLKATTNASTIENLLLRHYVKLASTSDK